MEVLLNGDPWKMLEGVAVVLLRIRQGPSFVLRESSFIQAGEKEPEQKKSSEGQEGGSLDGSCC